MSDKKFLQIELEGKLATYLSYFKNYKIHHFQELYSDIDISLGLLEEVILSDLEVLYSSNYSSSIHDHQNCIVNGFTANQALYLLLNTGQDDHLIGLLIDQVNFYNMDSLPSNTSINALKKLLKDKLELNKAVELIFKSIAYNDSDISQKVNLINFLIEEGANFREVSYYNIPTNLPLETYEGLIKNGLRFSELLRKALEITDNNELLSSIIKLAEAHGANFDEISSLPNAISIDFLEMLLSKGLSLSKAVSLVFGFSEYDGNHKSDLINLLIGKEANFSEVNYYNIPTNLPLETYEALFQKGLRSSELLRKALEITENNELQSSIIKLAEAHGANFDEISSLPNATSIDFLEMLLSKGLSLPKAVSLVFSVSDYDENYKSDLINLLIGKEANFSEVNYYNIPTNLPLKTYEGLIKNGLRPIELVKKALDMTDALLVSSLLEIALKNQFDFEELDSLPATITSDILDNLLSKGLSLSKVVSLVFDMNEGNQVKLIDCLIDKGVNFNQVTRIPRGLSFETYEVFLKKGLDASLLLSKAISENNDQLEDLALTYKIDFSALYSDSIPTFSSISKLEKYLDAGLTSDQALNYVLNKYQDLQQELAEVLINKGANVNEVFSRLVSSFVPDSTITFLLDKEYLDPNAVLKYAVSNNSLNIAKLAFQYRADIDTLDENLIIDLKYNKHLNMLGLLHDYGAKISMGLEEYVKLLKTESFSSTSSLVKIFADTYNLDRISDVLRFDGASDLDIKQFSAYYN